VIHPAPLDKKLPVQMPPPIRDYRSFPPPSDGIYVPKRPSPWGMVQQNQLPEQLQDISNQQLFEKLCTRLDRKSQQIDLRIDTIENQ
jgi:hypothetical protein